jgi:aminoacrylate hydrolase
MPFAAGESSSSIYYERLGSGGAPVLLCAGMGGSGRFWGPQLSALSDSHRVVVYDQVGTGRSSRALDGELTVARLAREMLAVLDAAQLPAAHVVGHAIGGLIGIELAARYPQRLLSLTIVNGWAKPDPHLRRCFAVRKEILVSSGPAAYLRAQPLFLFPPRWISDNAAHLDAELADQLAGFPAPEVMLRRIDTFLDFDATERLALVRVPTLIVTSRDDALVPCHLSDALVQGIEGACQQVFEYGAHAVTAVLPERFNQAVLSFLAQQDSKSPEPLSPSRF